MSAPAAAWHDVECGAYTADLELWRALAAENPGAVLDVGAGTGRVTLDLLRAGVGDVTALDADPELLAVLRERAGARPVATVTADARSFHLGRRFDLILVPMQTVQLLGGVDGRRRFLEAAARHLAPDAALAIALSETLEVYDDLGLPTPDLGEHDGLVLTSQPVRVRVEDGAWVIERVRRAVAPGGAFDEEHDEIRLDALDPGELEAEGAAAGLAVRPRRHIPETAEHVGSTVVVLGHG